ncbi:hypothetical protein JCM3770_001170 [Rhodotorula araucariae]
MVKVCLSGPATQAQIDHFLADYAPSASLRTPRNFVCQRDDEVDTPADVESAAGFDQFRADAISFEHRMIKQCQLIAEHAPRYGNKTLGLHSQKQLREMEHAKLKHNIKALAQKHSVLSGAWMAYLDEDDIDAAWRRVVEELTSPEGRLAAAGATYARVTSTRQSERMPWVLWVYVPDAYDPAVVETVDRVLVERCGYAPSAFKSILGITSKHPSKIAPSLYGTLAFMTREELTAAKMRFATHGPATCTSPLSGPPFEPEIDWDFVYVPPGAEGSAQPALPGAGAGAAASSSSSTPTSSPAAVKGKAPATKKRKAPVAPGGGGSGGARKKLRLGLFVPSSDSDGDSGLDAEQTKYEDRGGPASPSSRPTRRAAQKARERFAPSVEEKARVLQAQPVKQEPKTELEGVKVDEGDYLSAPKAEEGIKPER